MRRWFIGWAVASLALVSWLVIPADAAKKKVILTVGKNAFGFDIPLNLLGKRIVTEEPKDEHMVFWFEDIADMAGFKHTDIILREVPNLMNGYAFIWMPHPQTKQRVVVYDPNWVSDSKHWAPGFVMAHEIGHHACKHPIEGLASTPAIELEADRAAGALVALDLWANYAWLTDIDSVIRDMRLTLRQDATATHPALADRIAAVRKGYEEGSPCVSERFDDIIAKLNSSIHGEPAEAQEYYLRGRAYAAKKDFVKAIADYDQAIRLHPIFVQMASAVFVDAYKYRGLAYEAVGEVSKAIGDFRRVLSIESNDIISRRELDKLLH